MKHTITPEGGLPSYQAFAEDREGEDGKVVIEEYTRQLAISRRLLAEELGVSPEQLHYRDVLQPAGDSEA